MREYFKAHLSKRVEGLNDLIKWSIENGLGGKKVVLKPCTKGLKIKSIRM